MVTFTGSDIVLFVIGFFLPPLAVLFKDGCGCAFLINVCLTILGHIPGVIHAWWVIYSSREDPRAQRYQNPRAHIRYQDQQRSYANVAALPPPSGKATAPGLIHQHPSQQNVQYQYQQQQQQQQHQHYTTSTGTAVAGGSGPVYTTHTTQYAGAPAGGVPVDSKDPNYRAPPPPY
ncbi:hypothetical protein BC939DRAFT_443812 [Gamsiella multidivaricata]|uniref:uncharacterized protein n=1 Tax=Gamsiella multidivaricata TaxID=101098 RepID=UPI00221EC342|nr:uncharacterized protein BC939DRAFT_443812 [Gamsiella multidivaricata]KAI7828180.1 hypothetical protein BC939DRAFT_443812 [Gamsiella multidivaricata]